MDVLPDMDCGPSSFVWSIVIQRFPTLFGVTPFRLCCTCPDMMGRSEMVPPHRPHMPSATPHIRSSHGHAAVARDHEPRIQLELYLGSSEIHHGALWWRCGQGDRSTLWPLFARVRLLGGCSLGLGWFRSQSCVSGFKRPVFSPMDAACGPPKNG